MKKLAAILACALPLLLVASGCQSIEGTCSSGCDWAAGCADPGDEVDAETCESECVQMFDTISDQCQGPLLDFYGCATSKDCNVFETNAYVECLPDNMPLSCAYEMGGMSGGSGSDCCEADDPCDYADDGFCDCTEQAWDAADCA